MPWEWRDGEKNLDMNGFADEMRNMVALCRGFESFGPPGSKPSELERKESTVDKFRNGTVKADLENGRMSSTYTWTVWEHVGSA